MDKTPDWIKNLKDPVVKQGRYKIPIYSPYLKGNEKKYLLRSLDSTWLSSKGEYVNKYERSFASFCRAPYAVSTSSGTSALFLALKLIGIKPKDEVIVPTFTMISTAFAVSYTGATPVFVDCNFSDGNISVEQIEQKITKHTKAIIPVHIYGNPYDLDSLYALADKYNLAVIEDAAEAFGSEYKGKKIGGTGKTACFSNYINKIVTTGEGGMITIFDKKQCATLKKLNNYFFSGTRHFWHEKIGYNFRITNLQAAVGLAQLETAQKVISKKRQIFRIYKTLLNPVREYLSPLKENSLGKSNYWHVAFRVSHEKYNIQKLRNKLAQNGIETRTFFIPLHLQPVYRKSLYYGKFPNSEILAKTGILLPSGPDLTDNRIENITQLIKRFFLR